LTVWFAELFALLIDRIKQANAIAEQGAQGGGEGDGFGPALGYFFLGQAVLLGRAQEAISSP
jgi:hypothetical protein